MQYMFIYFWDTVYAAQAGLEVDILLAVLSSTGISGMCLHTWSMFVCLFAFIS